MRWLEHSSRRSNIPAQPMLQKAAAIGRYLNNGVMPLTVPELRYVIDALDTAYAIPPICPDSVKATWAPAEREVRGELEARLADLT
jgi:hypothetical protein